MEEAVDLLSDGWTHEGLQVRRVGVTELLEAGEVLQQYQSFDPAHPGDLLDHSQNQGVQQPGRAPSPEGVLSAPVDLEVRM